MKPIEGLRAAIDAFNTGGIDAALEYFDPDVEWETTGMFVDAGTYRGHEGIRRYMGAFYEEFDDLRFSLAEVVHEENPIVYRVRLDVVGRHSRAPVTIELWVVAEVRDGKLVTEVGAVPNPGLPAGTGADLMVRPDDVDLLLDGASEVEIVERRYRGEEVAYALQLPSGKLLHSHLRESHFAPGTRVRPVLHLRTVVAFPHDGSRAAHGPGSSCAFS